MELSQGSPRIICIGSNLESEQVLNSLIANKNQITALVTLPENEGIGVSDYVNLVPFCVDNSIRIIRTTDINSDTTLDEIRSLKPDYMFTLGWSQLFKKKLLEIPKYFVVGSHPSFLPAGKGRAPIPWTILERRERTAVTLFKMNTEADAGDILLQRQIKFKPDLYAGELYDLIASNLSIAFCDLYSRLRSKQLPESEKQTGAGSIRARRTPADGLIDFSKPAADIECLIRAVSKPYPGAYSHYNSEKITIWRVNFNQNSHHVGTIGQVLARDGDSILVQCADTSLWLKCFESHAGIVESSLFKLGTKFGYQVDDEIHFLKQKLAELEKRLSPDV
jgi:methionyl-tRNA formyltransferase